MLEYKAIFSKLNERLLYLQEIFPYSHIPELKLLESEFNLLQEHVEDYPYEELAKKITSLEELFFSTECRLDDILTPMDKVRIVRSSQRITLYDILENVYDNYTELGGQDEKTVDPAMLIARAHFTRKRNGKTYKQSVLVIGHEKGHGEEFRNAGAAHPTGNAKAKHYMRVAEQEGIPIHTYVFTPGAFPDEEYPGAAQQIAKNIFEMAAISVPIISVISEAGSGGAEAIALADKRLMLSHGYYSVISPEGAAAIEAKKKTDKQDFLELTAECAKNLHITADDNLAFGYIDKVIQEPVLGARPYHYEFFKTLRQEIIKATDEVVLTARGLAPLRVYALHRLMARELNLDEFYIRWGMPFKARRRLVENRQNKFINASQYKCINNTSLINRLGDAWSEQWWEIYNRLIYDFYKRNQHIFLTILDECKSEWDMLKMRLKMIYGKKKKRNTDDQSDDVSKEKLMALSDWNDENKNNFSWISRKTLIDQAVTCPFSEKRGCMDTWGPDLYGDFAGVCPTCGHHFPMEYQWVLNNCFDPDSFYEFGVGLESANPLNYPGFDAKLKEAKEKTGLRCSCITLEARLNGIQVILVILAGDFRGGSVGVAEGSKFVAATERARRKHCPLIVYCHGTAGIRIQEGTHGLIQMPRCTVAVRKFVEKGGRYIVLYDTKSYGGPVASFLGCSFYQFAIRSSEIGFAGPAVIKNTTGIEVPPQHHNCYNALSRGHIQGVWDRREVRTNLCRTLETMGSTNFYDR